MGDGNLKWWVDRLPLRERTKQMQSEKESCSLNMS